MTALMAMAPIILLWIPYAAYVYTGFPLVGGGHRDGVCDVGGWLWLGVGAASGQLVSVDGLVCAPNAAIRSRLTWST